VLVGAAVGITAALSSDDDGDGTAPNDSAEQTVVDDAEPGDTAPASDATPDQTVPLTTDTPDQSDQPEQTEPAATEPAATEPAATSVEETTTTTGTGTFADFVIEAGFSASESLIGDVATAGATVTNNGATSACNVSVQFSYLDGAGAPIDTTTELVEFIRPGERHIVAPFFFGFDIAAPTSLSVEIVDVESFVESTDITACGTFTIGAGINLEVVSAEIQRDEFFSTITGQVANPTDQLVEFASLHCLLLSGGAIFGGTSTVIGDPITPGGTVAFEAFPEVIPEAVDTAECQARA
jgi:hypothetical protein